MRGEFPVVGAKSLMTADAGLNHGRQGFAQPDNISCCDTSCGFLGSNGAGLEFLGMQPNARHGVGLEALPIFLESLGDRFGRFHQVFAGGARQFGVKDMAPGRHIAQKFHCLFLAVHQGNPFRYGWVHLARFVGLGAIGRRHKEAGQQQQRQD